MVNSINDGSSRLQIHSLNLQKNARLRAGGLTEANKRALEEKIEVALLEVKDTIVHADESDLTDTQVAGLQEATSLLEKSLKEIRQPKPDINQIQNLLADAFDKIVDLAEDRTFRQELILIGDAIDFIEQVIGPVLGSRSPLTNDLKEALSNFNVFVLGVLFKDPGMLAKVTAIGNKLEKALEESKTRPIDQEKLGSLVSKIVQLIEALPLSAPQSHSLIDPLLSVLKQLAPPSKSKRAGMRHLRNI